jgi:hypothetical protein
MELQDGFIVGIFNYCDSWCDTCPFTSHCRVFADIAEMTPPLLSDDPPSPHPVWRQELMPELRFASEHIAIDGRAETYGRRARGWLRDNGPRRRAEPGDPRSVISWFHLLIHVKAMRALRGLAEADPADKSWPADHDGSAKVALIGIDRSQTAWLDLVDEGLATPDEAVPFIEDLSWLRDALERTFPNARAFVRPGFDEPDAVANLRTNSGCG